MALSPMDAVLSLPDLLEHWLMLAYVGAVLVGARGLELLAGAHFRRAQRLGHAGFEYDDVEDHFHCPEGARLTMERLDPGRALAVYSAPPDRCKGCPRKSTCSPGEDTRRVYRSLAAWAETDVGRFHHILSQVMLTAAGLLMLANLWRGTGQRGMGLFLLGLIASALMLLRGFSRARMRAGSLESTESGPRPPRG